MTHFNLELAVATPFIDPEEKYIKTGNYTYGQCEMKLVSDFMICAVGFIEKVLVAGLQVLFANGPMNGKGTDYRVYYHQQKKFCDIRIQFEFNSYEVNIRIQRANSHRRISLYIDD